MKTYYTTLEFNTEQNNLLTLQNDLHPHVQDFDFFHIVDLTDAAYQWVKDSGIQNGVLTAQSMHTTCILSINELNEPCLLGDINNYLRDNIPKTKAYLHNSKIRVVNRCDDDYKCDRNADAHMKSFLFGSPTQSVIVKDGKPLFGTWQRLCLIDYDGPRKRQMTVQVMGE